MDDRVNSGHETHHDYQDKELVCMDCSSPFTFTGEEQRFYQEKGLNHEPKRCKPCRVARKGDVRGKGHGPNSRHAGGEGAPYGAGRGGAMGRRRGAGGAARGHDRAAGSGGMHGAHGGAPLFKADFGPSPWDQRRGEGGAGRGEGGAGRGRPQGQKYDAVCADCGASTQVPFRPNGVQPIWCRTCLPKHKTRRSGDGWQGSGGIE